MASANRLPPPPYQTALVDQPGDNMTAVWTRWLLTLITRVQQSAPILSTVSLTNQSASIGTTSIPVGGQAAGLFQVAWYLRITTAAGVASSATVTIGNTDHAVSCSQSGAAVTGNTTSTIQSGVVVVRADQAIAPTYAVAYVSNPAAAMKFSLDVILQGVS